MEIEEIYTFLVLEEIQFQRLQYIGVENSTKGCADLSVLKWQDLQQRGLQKVLTVTGGCSQKRRMGTYH